MSINFESNYLLLSISDQLCAYQKDRVSQMVRDFYRDQQADEPVSSRARESWKDQSR